MPHRRDRRFIVSAEGHRQCGVNKLVQVSKRRDIIASNVERQVFNLKYNMPGPGIEPRTTACQADLPTTTPQRLSIDRRQPGEGAI